jgi:hypothetical protein
VPPRQQRVSVPDQVVERPDLPSVRVAAKHQTHTRTRCLLGLPRCMGQQDGLIARGSWGAWMS